MINKSEIEFYQKYAGKSYDKNNEQDVEIKNKLNVLLKKITSCAKKARNSLFGESKLKECFTPLPHVIEAKENSEIRSYLFARFSPENKCSPIATYWFFVEGRPEYKEKHFRISLSLYDNNSSESLLQKYKKLQKDYKLEDSLSLESDISEEDLTQWIVNSIKSFGINYEDFCGNLQPDLDEVLSKLSERQNKKQDIIFDHKIWKMSHGKDKNIIESAHDWLMANNFIDIGYDPQHEQRKKFASMQDGDFFYLIRYSKIVLLGQIDGNEVIDTPAHLNQPNRVMRKFKKISSPIKELNSVEVPGKQGWKPQNHLAVYEVSQKELVEFEKTILQPAFGLSLSDLFGKEEIKSANKLNNNHENIFKMAKNIVLYGPPGTGKTFNTINMALAIADPSLDLKSSREEVKKLFDKKVNDRQIFFTTFHQSMSYEDFIEGIKPVLVDSDAAGQSGVSYKIENGLFKQACAFAAYNCYKKDKEGVSETQAYSFDVLYTQFINYLRKSPSVYKSLRGRDIEVKEINSSGSIIARAKDSVSDGSAPLTQGNLQKLHEKFHNIDQIKNLEQIREVIGIVPRTTEFYAVFKGLKDFEKQFKPDQSWMDEAKDSAEDFDTILRKYNDGTFDDAIRVNGEVADPVVLIIDEINRGNVSQIFGELITLIEDDKRLGKSEELKAVLPYSKRPFGVPANLYIIGTMNTADRSVEALDAALRRRFSFVEKLPDSSLIAKEGKQKNSKGVLTLNGQLIELPLLLDTINSRVARLLDKDHQIGHSYFMSVTDQDSLLGAFKDKIIPLLQEYFFGDYGKIGLVLGEQFVEKVADEPDFATFPDYDASDYEEKISYKIKDINSGNIEAAVQSILSNKLQDAS